LVHRDIKPANIMLNRRGCTPDFVKVLDFGLVKDIDNDAKGSDSLAGTPFYMSPEAIQSPISIDARSDLYAVGAVAYFLLTGEPVFMADNIVELCQKHVDEKPIVPSERMNKKVSSELEDVLLACLDKSRANRPQTARDLADRLDHCPHADAWTIELGDAWWSRHEREPAQTDDAPTTTEETQHDRLDQTMEFESSHKSTESTD
jgi:serine/threonine protein kinase